eukprot:9760392-Alexandrium_andersonii.AAC.1
MWRWAPFPCCTPAPRSQSLMQATPVCLPGKAPDPPWDHLPNWRVWRERPPPGAPLPQNPP